MMIIKAKEKRYVFRCILKVSMEGEDLTFSGKLFHSFGPTREKV